MDKIEQENCAEKQEVEKLKDLAVTRKNQTACSRRGCVFPTRDYSALLTAPWRLNPHVLPLRRVSCEQQLDMFVFERALFPIHLFEEIRAFQACASSHLSVEEIRVFQACTCGN